MMVPDRGQSLNWNARKTTTQTESLSFGMKRETANARVPLALRLESLHGLSTCSSGSTALSSRFKERNAQSTIIAVAAPAPASASSSSHTSSSCWPAQAASYMQPIFSLRNYTYNPSNILTSALYPIPMSSITIYTAASVYSQDSYVPVSPAAFSEARPDSCRFGLLVSAGARTAGSDDDDAESFRFDTRSANDCDTRSPSSPSSGYCSQAHMEAEEAAKKDGKLGPATFLTFPPQSPPPCPSPMEIKNRQSPPSSPPRAKRKKVLSRMLSRLSLVSYRRGSHECPPSPASLPLQPPQIEVVLPSPGLDVNLEINVKLAELGFGCDSGDTATSVVVLVSPPERLSRPSLPSLGEGFLNTTLRNRDGKAEQNRSPPSSWKSRPGSPVSQQSIDVPLLQNQRMHKRSASTSSWKPARPASPMPRRVSTQREHKRKAGSVSLSLVHSPVALPARSSHLSRPSLGRGYPNTTLRNQNSRMKQRCSSSSSWTPPQSGSPVPQGGIGERMHKRSASTSSWKPARPASPIPRRFSVQKQHKRKAGSVSLPVVHPPVPPLPVRAVPPPPMGLPPEGFGTVPREEKEESTVMTEVERQLRARAKKSEMYAGDVYGCGVVSPLLIS